METDDDLGNELHKSLVSGDPTAQARIAEQVLPAVLERLNAYRIARRADEQLIADAVTEAFFEYANRPSGFDPAKLNLASFLCFVAHRNLQNLLEKLVTRKKHEKRVELVGARRNETWEEDLIERDERNHLLAQIPGETIEDKLASILPEVVDQNLCLLMLNGERETAVFAELLSLSGDPQEVRQEVKRHKDRIIKILQRFRNNLRHGRSET